MLTVNQPSLKLFYNYGRLPLKLHGGSRVSWTELDHDREWIKTKKGRYCKVCGNLLSGRMKLFCSHKCSHFFETEFRQIRTWESFRNRVWERDNGKCVLCGKGVPHLFVCDHIIALCNGGRDWYNDPIMFNFQTLCLDCNKKKTHEDIQRLVVTKKRVKAVGEGGLILLDFSSNETREMDIK